MPDFVCDIRDFWMLDFAERSPYRPYFKWCIMPTVDARPQARQWISTYQSADACLTYSDWAGGILDDQSGGKINYLGSSPPSAHAQANSRAASATEAQGHTRALARVNSLALPMDDDDDDDDDLSEEVTARQGAHDDWGDAYRKFWCS